MKAGRTTRPTRVQKLTTMVSASGTSTKTAANAIGSAGNPHRLRKGLARFLATEFKRP